MTDSPFEVGLRVSLNKSVHGSNAAFVGFGVGGGAGKTLIFSICYGNRWCGSVSEGLFLRGPSDPKMI